VGRAFPQVFEWGVAAVFVNLFGCHRGLVTHFAPEEKVHIQGRLEY